MKPKDGFRTGGAIDGTSAGSMVWASVVRGAVAEEIRDIAAAVTYGWGMIPVTSRIGDTKFTTSSWPKGDEYYLPIKDAVRVAENVRIGSMVTARMSLRPK